jgi:hypothetical protein
MIKFGDFSSGRVVEKISKEELIRKRPSSESARQRLSRFVTAVLDDDEVYYYSSIAEDWEQGEGSEGYVIVRAQIVVDSYVTRMN